MRENSTSNRGIERRTMIGLLGSGMAGLAGCFGGSTDEGPDDGSGGTEDGSASSPDDQSEYLESTSIVAGDRVDLVLEISVVDDRDWGSVSLITEAGENYATEVFGTGETLVHLPLTEGNDTFDPVPPGDHTLFLTGEDVETEIPFRLGGQMELSEAVSGSSRAELEEKDLGLIFRNTGSHADAVSLTTYNGLEDEPLRFAPIQPGETGLAEILDALTDNTYQCDDNEGVRHKRYTVEFLWSETATVTVPIEYTATSRYCELSLAGPATATFDGTTES